MRLYSAYKILGYRTVNNNNLLKIGFILTLVFTTFTLKGIVIKIFGFVDFIKTYWSFTYYKILKVNPILYCFIKCGKIVLENLKDCLKVCLQQKILQQIDEKMQFNQK